MQLTVESLSYAYRTGNAQTVFADVSFTAESGQNICLLGHNGVGKSTLFRCLLGLAEGYKGRIFFDATELKKLTPRELSRRVAYIPQTTDPTFNYSVIDVVLMGRTSRLGPVSSATAEDERIAFDALDRLGIVALAPCGYTQISGGERQLVLIARALAQQTPMLIMDEPTANLDYGNQWRTMQLIDCLRNEGYLILMSTHNPQQALTWATHVLVLHDGMLLTQGPPREALSAETMQRIYDIPVHIIDAADENGRIHQVCIPGDQ